MMWKAENKVDACTLYLRGTVLFSPSPPCRYESISAQGSPGSRVRGRQCSEQQARLFPAQVTRDLLCHGRFCCSLAAPQCPGSGNLNWELGEKPNSSASERLRNGTSGLGLNQGHIKGQWVQKTLKMFLLGSQECSVPVSTAVPWHHPTAWGALPLHSCAQLQAAGLPLGRALAKWKMGICRYKAFDFPLGKEHRQPASGV